ncbi:MAG: fatty acid desaturase [Verrucomicrobiaceae bacterium]
MNRIPFHRVNWVNTSFLFVITTVGIIAAPIFLFFNFSEVSPLMWGMFAFYMIATGLSITLGYHRLFSHLSFKAKWPVRLATLVFGACAFENSVIHWASDHRRHHKHVDEDEDPYDISKGFFWAHIGWILFKLDAEQPIDNVKDLRRDVLVRLQDRFYVLVAFVVGLILPAAIGYIEGGAIGAWAGFLVVGALRVVLVQQCTFFINSLCHMIGDQPYSTRCSARDSWIMALVTYGEGYHNYHHEFQHDYRNGVKVWNFDPTKWSIIALEKMGLVSDLRRVPTNKIVAAEMREAQRKAEQRIAELSEQGSLCDQAVAKINGMIDQLSKNLEEIEKMVTEQIETSRENVKRWRKETRDLIDQLGDLRLLPA